MLRTLHIENIALIKEVDLTFDAGFSVLTGETGAGKSILIDSVSLLLGGKANRELVRTGADSALVCGVFEALSPTASEALTALGYPPDEDGCLSVSRTLTADGRGSMRIDGKPVTASVGREIGKYLLNIHGQNDNQRLLMRSAHLELLDAMGDYGDDIAAYRALYRELCACREELAGLNRSEAEQLRLREMLEYQIRDIDSVKPRPGEDEALEQERVRLKNTEKIEKNVRFVANVLDTREKSASVSYLLGRGSAALRQIADIIPEADGFADQLDDMLYRVRDLAETVRAWSDDEAGDPTARLDAVEGRLDAIARLRRKYGATVADILAFRDKAKTELESIDNAGQRTGELQKKLAALEEKCRSAAALLRDKRRAAGELFTRRVGEELAFLDMPRVRFSVAIHATQDFTPNGLDDVEFLIATNPGEPLGSMIRIASGGELSRLMLAIKSVLNDRDGVGSVIFDEVDTGISGKTSQKVGIRLRQMGKGVQVICVTHAAQVASQANAHYRISKEEVDGRNETHVVLLNKEERVAEIARILGGIQVTETQKNAAAEMLAEAKD